ncbi:MAG TPA: hypothetical protein VIN60_07995 [Anaerolineales bacterium]
MKKHRSASAAQIGHGLNMSAANVRHHLSVMLRDGRIAVIGEKRSESRGRPINLYGLSEKSLGDNFALLSDAILFEFLKELSPKKRDEAIGVISRNLALQFGAVKSNGNVPMAKRLSAIVEKLNELHYEARWEAGAEGPRILFAHCPYTAIIEKHSELCKLDETLLTELLGVKTQQLAKIGQPPSSSLYCVFCLL